MENCRLLVIDDLASIHEDFKKILTPPNDLTEQQFAELDKKLFGEAHKKPKRKLPPFHIDFASQGEEGVNLVQQALIINNPYAVAFVDVLMPPGKDGIDTIEKIWDIDKEIQTVICTAYSMYSWEDLIERFGETDRLFIVKKPFDPLEIIQMACTLVKRWNLNHSLKMGKVSHFQNAEMEKSIQKMNATVNSLKDINQRLKKMKGTKNKFFQR